MSKKEVVVKPNNATMQSAMIDIVQRADIDPDKLEKFLDLQIKMEDRQAKQSFNLAMAEFQRECPIIVQNKKGHNNTYATYDQIIHQVRPLMVKNGLSFAFNTRPAEENTKSNLTIKVMHSEGHSEEFDHQYFNLDEGGKMNNSQRIKSALTYAKRALLENAFGIATQGMDDDAKRAIDDPATSEELEKIKQRILNSDIDENKFLKFLQLERLEDMTRHDIKKASNALEQKRGRDIAAKTL